MAPGHSASAPRPSGRIRLEIAIESGDEARRALAAGADRVELCAALELGGLTPSAGTIQRLPAIVADRCSVMIRPRPGGFIYSPAEFAVMQADIDAALAAGASGVVLGVLRGNEIDERACRLLARHTHTAPRPTIGRRPFATSAEGGERAPLQLVFHRAFDLAANPFDSLELLIAMGFTRVLTSGGGARAAEPAALERIRALIDRARGRIAVVACGGVRAANVAHLRGLPGLTDVHAGRRTAPASTAPGAIAGAPIPPFSLGVWSEPDLVEIAALRTALDATESDSGTGRSR